MQSIGKVPSKDTKYVDIYRERPMKVAVKVLVPVREHPKVCATTIIYSLYKFLNKKKTFLTFIFSSILLENYWVRKEIL